MVARIEKQQWDKKTNCVENDNFDDGVQMKTKSLPYDRSRREFPESPGLPMERPRVITRLVMMRNLGSLKSHGSSNPAAQPGKYRDIGRGIISPPGYKAL